MVVSVFSWFLEDAMSNEQDEHVLWLWMYVKQNMV